jgi:hypothetical protein
MLHAFPRKTKRAVSCEAMKRSGDSVFGSRIVPIAVVHRDGMYHPAPHSR